MRDGNTRQLTECTVALFGRVTERKMFLPSNELIIGWLGIYTGFLSSSLIGLHLLPGSHSIVLLLGSSSQPSHARLDSAYPHHHMGHNLFSSNSGLF